MSREKALLQSLIDRRRTNSYTREERETLVTLSDRAEKFEDETTYLIFRFEGVRDIIIYLKCETEELDDFTFISIPNQKIIKREMLDEI